MTEQRFSNFKGLKSHLEGLLHVSLFWSPFPEIGRRGGGS